MRQLRRHLPRGLRATDEPANVVPKYQQGDPAHGEVGKELEACVQEAADSCPVTVIHVE